MCRLLGVVAREPVAIRSYLLDAPHGLQGMSLCGVHAPHRDGVGWAYRDLAGRMRLYRWGATALARTQSLPGNLSAPTTLLLAHARKASPEYRGMQGALQAQPLVQDGLFLAHNGTIRDVALLGAGAGTDSQRLLGWLNRTWNPRTPDRVPAALRDLAGLLRDYTAVNFLLSEGASLYALCLYTREPDYYTLRWRDDGGAIVVASEPIDDRPGWRSLGNGELLTIGPDLSATVVQAVSPPT